MGFVKKIIKRLFYLLGYEIIPYRPKILGINPFRDINGFVTSSRPILLDVGANKGQSVHFFKDQLPKCIIHSFEPGTTAYEELTKNTKNYSDVYINNLALGQTSGKKTFHENSSDDLSSFLDIDEDCPKVVNEVLVEISTVDQYCNQNNIKSIDILKIDTQGYDLEVLKGAISLIKHNHIHMILIEIVFWEMYKNMPPWDVTFRFLTDNNFKLISFYELTYKNHLASWTDALFINPQYKRA